MSQFASCIRSEVADANRILADQLVLDAFGHVSARSLSNPDRFFLSRSLAPEMVLPADILEYDLNAEPVEATRAAQYSERIIHGAIYRARPDVNAICHHHAPRIMPFCLTDMKLKVVTQLGACIGTSTTPTWDQRDEFGTTNHLVTNQKEADSLARTLADYPMVLMKRHGATVVGSNMQDLVFRCVYSCRDAGIQTDAALFGAIDAFTDDEIALAAKFPQATLDRAWTYWRSRISKH